MRRASPQMRNFAKRLIVSEAKGKVSAQTAVVDTFNVCERVRPQLTTLMGNAGFQALLSRALTLAGAEVPWLRAVHVGSGGIMEALKEFPPHLDGDQFSEGRVILLAHLLGLMVTFIGESLTLRLVREIWPEAPLNGLDLGNED